MAVPFGEIKSDVLRSCRHVALATDRYQADYILSMTWTGQKWEGVLQRHDSVVLHDYLDPDSSAIVRDACKQLASDSDWPAVERPRTTLLQRQPTARPDRYELREMRSGSTITTGVIDKQTGKVWVWTSLPGGTMFFKEDMVPEPAEEEATPE